MKKILSLLLALCTALLMYNSNGCKNHVNDPSDNDTNQVVVKKPNIYLYPESKSNITVKLNFPVGGGVIQSIPAYSGGWQVTAEPSGKINDQYDYLFYESKNPDLFQNSNGWVIGKNSLTEFFSQNLKLSGFSAKEINDFIDYWIPLLTNSPYYIIYPQYSDDIDKVIDLKISPAPDNVLRLFYVIKGAVNNIYKLPEPVIPKFNRTGFVVIEWGVVLK